MASRTDADAAGRKQVRPKGSRNAGFEARRAELLARLRVRLTDREGPLPTLRALAAAAGCGISTLTHYFGRREDIIRAVFADIALDARTDREAARQSRGDFCASIHAEALRAGRALNEGRISDCVAMGLAEGMGHPILGPAFLDMILEPFVIALAERCRDHIERGEMRDIDPRLAALGLLSPLLIGALHQRALGGDRYRPLDTDALARHVAEGFVRAWGSDPAP